MGQQTTLLEAGFVGRCICSKRSLKPGKEIPPKSFRDKKSPMQIPVHRLIPLGESPDEHPELASDERMAKIGDDFAKNLVGNRHFYGWAVLSVEDAAQVGRTVRSSPQDDNPWHADIVLPDDDERALQRHTAQLADCAKARLRPSCPNAT